MTITAVETPTDETVLTVAEAAFLTGYSVQAFYTKSFRDNYGLVKPETGVWTFTLKELKAAGLVDENNEGRRRRQYGVPSFTKSEVSSLTEKNAALSLENNELKKRVEILDMLLAEKSKQIELFNRILSSLDSK